MNMTLLAACAALLLPLAARADHLPMPTEVPPSYKTECGSCHLAFPPALLAASDWHMVMAQLSKHYGDNATLDEKTRQQIDDFLVRNGGSRWRQAGSGNPPRLTATDWFRHEHGELSSAIWRDKRIGSPANCAACHPGAEGGRFSEHEITMPGHARSHD